MVGISAAVAAEVAMGTVVHIPNPKPRPVHAQKA